MQLFNGLKKAVTFSYDDGVFQDKRLIDLFDKYGLKATFNLNSGLMNEGNIFKGKRLSLSEIKETYKNHEVAVHTFTHASLNTISDDEIVNQIEKDRMTLEDIVGYDICGMAYPNGTAAIDDRVINIVREKTPIKYARATDPTMNFDIQYDLLNFRPTIHHKNFSMLFKLADEFINLKTDKPQIFYIWGHAYEFDEDGGVYWDKFEEFCKLISNRNDIFYGTNREVLLAGNNG